MNSVKLASNCSCRYVQRTIRANDLFSKNIFAVNRLGKSSKEVKNLGSKKITNIRTITNGLVY